jgi:3-deoxy-7-phosphoheptulonate synthase
MTEKRIENINILAEESILTPDKLKAEFPLSESAIATVETGQKTVKKIINREDPRLFVVVGPCSIHDVEAAREYAAKLRELAEEVRDTLYLIMRVYFEKPRTRRGWQGFINDPYLDHSFQLEDGLKMARKLLLDIAETGLPTAGEALDLVTPQYIQDLFSWTAIGARTTESQSHRKMASGLSSAVGFKNATNGDLIVAINALLSAAGAHHFLSVDPSGHVAIIRTNGNPYAHIVLRGGNDGPNYGAEAIQACEEMLRKADLPRNIMVDCSHANSGKDCRRQLEVLQDIGGQVAAGNESIIGIMLESNLLEGRQDIPENPADLKYGLSITDACLDWPTTADAIRKLNASLLSNLTHRRK